MFASVQPPVIFIDKLIVSGIEIMILDWSLQEIASSPGSLLVRPLDFHCRGLAAI